MKPLFVSSGEPAGIGPDICLALADLKLPIVVAADLTMLQERAALLKKKISFQSYPVNGKTEEGTLTVFHIPCPAPVKPGHPTTTNAPYVLDMLTQGVEGCLNGKFSGLVTAPVHKAIINDAGIPFSGHTEFLAKLCNIDTVVMLLACEAMRVALVTTHLPLNQVSKALNSEVIMNVIQQLHHSLQKDFAIGQPKIYVAGLNPHAGEGGHLGHEEIDVIIPALEKLRASGLNIKGPLPADTLFSIPNCQDADVFVTMYHDQGLPVLKYAGFGQAVNITLGLPIIRTSVDHGTALELAGSGKANHSSLLMAIQQAIQISKVRG